MLLGLEVYLGYLDGLRLVMGIDKAIPGLGREPKIQDRPVITANEVDILYCRLYYLMYLVIQTRIVN